MSPMQRAQASYDAMEPPEFYADDEEAELCAECEGLGWICKHCDSTGKEPQ